VGGIPPEGGIEAAYKRQLAEAADPAALRAEINVDETRGWLAETGWRVQDEESLTGESTLLVAEAVP
jgi:hypothetical protein